MFLLVHEGGEGGREKGLDDDDLGRAVLAKNSRKAHTQSSQLASLFFSGHNARKMWKHKEP